MLVLVRLVTSVPCLCNRCFVFGAFALSFFWGFVMSRSVSFARSLRASRTRRGARTRSVVPVRLTRGGASPGAALWSWRLGARLVSSFF